MEAPQYEIYLIDPNDDDKLQTATDNLDNAKRLRMRYAEDYAGSGCRVEIWRDGEPVETSG